MVWKNPKYQGSSSSERKIDTKSNLAKVCLSSPGVSNFLKTKSEQRALLSLREFYPLI